MESPQNPPGHVEPAGVPGKAAAAPPSMPATPQRCQESDRLVALTTTSVLSLAEQHDEQVVVPLGAVLCPSPSKSLPTYALEPATCTHCGAFINVYAPASGARGEWHCNFCLHFNSGGGGSASGGLALAAAPANAAASPAAGAAAAAAAASSAAFITPPPIPGLGSAAAAAAAASGRVASAGGSMPSTPLTPLAPRLLAEAVDYVAPWPPAQSPVAGALPRAGAGAAKGLAVMVVDLCASPQDFRAVQSALLRAAEALPAAARVALVTCAATVQAYRLGPQPGTPAGSTPLASGGLQQGQQEAVAVACDVLPGDVREEALPGGSGGNNGAAGGASMLLGALQPEVHVARVGQCRGMLLAALRSLRPFRPCGKPRARCLLGGVEAALHLCQLPYWQDAAAPFTPPPAAAAAPAAAEPGQQQGDSEIRLTQQEQEQQQQQRRQLQSPRGTPGLGGPQTQLMDRDGGSRPPGHVVVITTGRATQGYAPLPAEEQQGTAGSEEEEEAAWEERRRQLRQQQGEQPGQAAAAASGHEVARLAREVNSLANRAALAGVTVDMLAAGADPDLIPALAPLAQGTAGLFVSHTHCNDSFAANIATAVRRPAGLTASLEVRTSSGLAVRDTYGAVVPLFSAGRPTDQWQALTGGDAPPPPRWLNRRTWHYRCGPPSDSAGVTLVLHCDRPPAQTYAYIQVAWSWVDEGGHWLQRIVTRRLSTTHNPVAVVEALDAPVAAAVWGKALMVQALERGAAFDRKEAEILRRSLGKRLFEFVSRFGFPVESSRGWFTGPSRFVLPAVFLPIAQALYCLHRGPMLHHALGGHPEERALLQAHFMTASLQVSQLLCVPTLYLLTHPPAAPAGASLPAATDAAAAAAVDKAESGEEASPPDAGSPAGTLPPPPPRIRTVSRGDTECCLLRQRFAEAPAVDLALHDAAAAVLDHGSHMYVWLAEGLAGADRGGAEALCLRFALELGSDRMPVPEVVVDSAKCLQRLMPIRSDPHRAQLQQAPVLASASRAGLERVARALGPCVEPSFYQWLQEHGVQQIQDSPAGGAGSGVAAAEAR